MACHTCGVEEGLELCLYCGRSFCAIHRGQLDGVATCSPCLKAEHARKHKPKRAAAVAAPATTVEVAARPLAPLPEPKGWMPLLWGFAAALPCGGYLYYLFGWLTTEHELQGWVQSAGSAAGAAFVFAGVWAIAKSR